MREKRRGERRLTRWRGRDGRLDGNFAIFRALLLGQQRRPLTRQPLFQVATPRQVETPTQRRPLQTAHTHIDIRRRHLAYATQPPGRTGPRSPAFADQHHLLNPTTPENKSGLEKMTPHHENNHRTLNCHLNWKYLHKRENDDEDWEVSYFKHLTVSMINE